MPVDLIGYLYAATVAAGGVMGYVKASSIPSLAAGLTFGGLLGVGAYMTSQNPPRPLMQLGTAVVLAGVMGARFSKSGKLMPAGIICIISCAAIIRNIILHHNQFPMLGGR